MSLAPWILLAVLPWPIRRWILNRVFKWDIHSSACISRSVVRCKSVKMAAGSSIHGMTIINGLSHLEMGENAELGAKSRAFSEAISPSVFPHCKDRNTTLTIGAEASVLGARIDCQDHVRIGAFTTLAGRETLILTHQIDIKTAQMQVAPVEIGSYCMIGARVTLLSGSKIPNYCALGAGAVLTKSYDATHTLYAGVPARPIKALDSGSAYFHRSKGKLK